MHFRYNASMNYLSTWITPNEKHWFPKTFPNVNHSFCGNHNYYPSQYTTSTYITNVPLKLPQSFKIPLVGCIQCSSHLDFFILEKKNSLARVNICICKICIVWLGVIRNIFVDVDIKFLNAFPSYDCVNVKNK